MAYSKTRSGCVSVSKSPSMLYGNLTCNGTTCAFAHRGEVMTFAEGNLPASGKSQSKDASTLKPRLPEAKVFSVRWCHLAGRDYLAVGTGAGLAVYDCAPAMSCIFLFDLSSADIPYPDPDAAFVRGVAACTATNHICAGSSNGNIFVVSVEGDSIGLTQTIPPHATDKGACTSCIDSRGDHVAVASDSGSLLVMNAAKGYEEVMFFSHSAPCTSVVVSDEFVVAGYATGMLRLLRLGSRSVYAEIGGHSRCITAIDMHPEMRRFVSVGLDSAITVWDLPSPVQIDEEHAEVRVVFTDLAKDATFVGVQFSRNGTADLIATCYDQDRVRTYPST